MTTITKITAKGQTTVPRDIRSLLDVKPGDLIAWEPMADGSVQVRGMQPLEVESLRAVEDTLSEWASPADEDAYREL